MENFRNYYDLLGVQRSATPEEIKRAFRRLARQYHPDMNPGDKAAEEKFKEFNEAYRVLSDPATRSQYDQFTRFWRGRKGRSNPDFRANPPTESRPRSDEDYGQFRDFNSFIDQLLGRRPRPNDGEVGSPETSPVRGRTSTVEREDGRSSYQAPPRPKNVEAELNLPIEKAYLGGRERIKLEDGRSLEVEMPPGMLPGHQIRLRGQGIANGDLFLKIGVLPHPRFRLLGRDIHCTLPVTPAEAVLGGAVEVPTLDGLVKITLPEGVVSGQRLRLAHKGFPTEGEAGSSRGDQLLEIQIVLPRSLSTAERDLYTKLREIETYNPRLDDGGG